MIVARLLDGPYPVITLTKWLIAKLRRANGFVEGREPGSEGVLMLVEKDVLIPVNDGSYLRANIYHPASYGRFPVLMSLGIYGKDIHFADGYKPQWEKLLVLNPQLCDGGTSGKHLRWEKIDPERWVPDGYVVISIDGRGSGKSPGYLDPFSPRETQDYYDAIEWAAIQPWASGKIGLIGISYLSIKQWQVAALRPPHLATLVSRSRHGSTMPLPKEVCLPAIPMDRNELDFDMHPFAGVEQYGIGCELGRYAMKLDSLRGTDAVRFNAGS